MCLGKGPKKSQFEYGPNKVHVLNNISYAVLNRSTFFHSIAIKIGTKVNYG